MTGHVIDERWLGSLHVRALRAAGVDHDPVAERGAFQVGTIEALLGGAFDGESTIEQVLSHGTLGVGTLNHLAGEMVIVDGVAYLCDARGATREVRANERTPFAVVSAFRDPRGLEVGGISGVDEFAAALEKFTRSSSDVLAVRLEGHFSSVALRSVHPQHPPYVSLARAVAHQVEFTLDDVAGTLVGFRFPDDSAGVEVPGFHMHFLTRDLSRGGHVLGFSLVAGRLEVDATTELRVELPSGVGLGVPGAADRAAINAVESQRA